MINNNKFKCALFKLDPIIERENPVPIVINYRNFPINTYYCINYIKKHYCTWKCKYSKQIYEKKLSKPYIDIQNEVYVDNLVKDIDDVFIKYIFFDINTICKENEYACENDKFITFYIKKYEILNLIKKIFTSQIVLYEQKIWFNRIINPAWRKSFHCIFWKFNTMIL